MNDLIDGCKITGTIKIDGEDIYDPVSYTHLDVYKRQEQIKGGDYLPYTTRELLARLIKCEAGGEGDDGMAAVASVVRNRDVYKRQLKNNGNG